VEQVVGLAADMLTIFVHVFYTFETGRFGVFGKVECASREHQKMTPVLFAFQKGG
jgi:hypothetical protein